MNAGSVNIDDFILGINDYWDSEETSTNTSYYEYSETPDIMSIVFMDKDESVYAFWPYRQLYAGINGYLFDDRLYFNLGLDSEFHAGPDGPNPNPTSLTEVYSKAITENVAFLAPQDGNPVDQDLNGLPGPSFNLGQTSTLQQDSLLNIYSGVHGNSQFTAGPVPLPGPIQLESCSNGPTLKYKKTCG